MYAIAIDMGGTKIEGSIVSDKAKISDSMRIPTGRTRSEIIGNLAEVILSLKSKTAVKGVGISMPGMIKEGKVLFGGGTLTSLIGLDLAKELKRKTGLPVYIENDANCFALAEAAFGAGKSYSKVLGVIWGTGVGGGIVIDRKIYGGATGGAGEFGHNVIDHKITKGPKCGCGARGCLEMLSSGKNIERLYQERGGKMKGAKTPDIYKSKEKAAKDTINDAIYYFGLGLSHLINTLNPDIIVLGGGVSLLPDDVYRRVRKVAEHFSVKPVFKSLKIVRHRIGDSSAVLGAAAMVFESS